MANVQTLISPEELNARLTPEQRRENASKAGIASGEARRRKKTLRELIELYGSEPSAAEPNLTNDEKLILAQYRQAAKGDTKAATFIRDTKGEKPHDVLETPDIEMKPLVDLTKRAKNGAE